MLIDAKRRAIAGGIKFELTMEDILMPRKCPVLGIPLKVSRGRASSSSPSLDRIVPSRGYVPGNVLVVSHRANLLKRDATLQEMRLLYRFYRKVLT